MSAIQGQIKPVFLIAANPENLKWKGYRPIAPRPPSLEVEHHQQIGTAGKKKAKKKKPQDIGNQRTFACPVCGRSFTHSSSMYIHVKRTHKTTCRALQKGGGPIRCREEDCNNTFNTVDLLRQHLQEKHNMEFSTETLLFSSYGEFTMWKTEMELRTKSSFQKLRGARATAEGRVEKFSCNRSGFVSQGEKSRPSFKIDGHCTATLTVRVLGDDSVRVAACHTHYNHEIDLACLRLRTRHLEGIGVSKVLKNFADNETASLRKRKGQLALMLKNVGKKTEKDRLLSKKEKLHSLLKEIQEKTTKISDAVVLTKVTANIASCLQDINSYLDGDGTSSLCKKQPLHSPQSRKRKLWQEEPTVGLSNLCAEIENEHFYAAQYIDSIIEIEEG